MMQEKAYYSVRMRASQDAPRKRRKAGHHLLQITGRGEWLIT